MYGYMNQREVIVIKSLTKNNKKMWAGVILVAIILAIALFCVFMVNHYQGPVRLVNRYVESVNTKNAETFVSCLPPSYQETVNKKITAVGGANSFFEETYSGMFEGDKPYESFGENVMIAVSDCEAQRQTITDGIYNGMDVSSINATAVTVVTCTMTTKGSLREVSETVEVLTVKIRGKWYMLNMEVVTPRTPDETPTNLENPVNQ